MCSPVAGSVPGRSSRPRRPGATVLAENELQQSKKPIVLIKDFKWSAARDSDYDRITIELCVFNDRTSQTLGQADKL